MNTQVALLGTLAAEEFRLDLLATSFVIILVLAVCCYRVAAGRDEGRPSIVQLPSGYRVRIERPSYGT